MFHIKYPQVRGFYSWDELGCLARALGFPKDLFKINITDEIAHEDNGLPEKELLKMLAFNMLFSSLHLSLNNHTADWNCCVIRKCISTLDKQALTFEDLYNARLAYQAYEAADMKGMLIEQHIILRTLKMCGKTISPMKLMHRVKHSKDSFEEAGRMQLYEFLDLILWANEYEAYTPQKTYGHFEMEDEMFKLLDFDSLLSHHDQKLADRLDQQYLDEEWTFSREKLGEKGRFKEPPVACSESRLEMARDQRKKYQGLKNEVVSSQKTVYYSQQGFVRPRPLTAPNLTMFKQTDEEIKRKLSAAAHNALYNKYQKILKNAYNKGKVAKVTIDHSDRPAVDDYVRCETPRIVTETDLRETNEEFCNIMFNKETARTKYEIKMDTEMDYYIPDFNKDKWLEQKESAINPREVLKRKAWEEKNLKYSKDIWMKNTMPKLKDDKAGHYDNNDIINHLTYPVNRLPPSHAKKCDASYNIRLLETKFRGWYNTRSKKGAHYILVSPYFHNSPKGRLMQKLAKMSDEEINKLHGEFLFRYTSKNQVEKRPVTAPPVLAQNKDLSFKSPSSGYYSMDDKSRKTTPGLNVDTGKRCQVTPKAYIDVDKIDQLRKDSSADKHREVVERKATLTDDILEEIKIKLNKIEGKRLNDTDTNSEMLQEDMKPVAEHFDTPDKKNDDSANDGELEERSLKSEQPDKNVLRETGNASRESSETSVSETIRKLTDEKPKTKIRSKSAYVKRHDKLQNDDMSCIANTAMHPRAKSAMETGKLTQDDLVPTPYMDHSKPKVVSVGSIGKISLLESISESKYWEDILLEELAKRQAEQNGGISQSSSDSAYSDIDSNEDFEHLKSPRPKRRTKSKSSRSSQSAILAMILAEEKSRRKKVKSRSSEYSVLNKSRKSPLTKSPRSNRSISSATSNTGNVQSPVVAKKTPVTDIKSGKCPEDIVNTVEENSENLIRSQDIETLKAEEEETLISNGEIATNNIKDDNTRNIGKTATKDNIKQNDKRKNNSEAFSTSYQGNKLNKSNLRKKQPDEEELGKLKTDSSSPKQKKVIILSTHSMEKCVSKKSAKRYERLVNRMDGTISETLSKRLLSTS